MLKIADIDFRTPAKKRHSVHHHEPDDYAISLSKHQGNHQAISDLFQEPSEADIRGFYSALAKDDSNKPAVLSLIPEHCEGYIPLNAKPNILPLPLKSLFDETCTTMTCAYLDDSIKV